MLELVFAFEHDWTEIITLTEAFLLHLIRSLQQRPKYRVLLERVQSAGLSAGDLKLGLDSSGKLQKLTFAEAKHILQNVLGRSIDERADLT